MIAGDPARRVAFSAGHGVCGPSSAFRRPTRARAGVRGDAGFGGVRFNHGWNDQNGDFLGAPRRLHVGACRAGVAHAVRSQGRYTWRSARRSCSRARMRERTTFRMAPRILRSADIVDFPADIVLERGPDSAVG
jgi:hypothetical protein